MLGRVAKLYYEHGLTHQQIAEILGLSRIKITRLLAEARRVGIVEIRVHSDETIFTDLELELTQRFGLQQAWVAPTLEGRAALLDSIGTVGATCLQTVLEPGMTVMVGLSETLGAIAPHVQRDAPLDAHFVAAIGSRPASNGIINPHEVAQALAEAFGGTARHLPAPVVASSPELAARLRNEPHVTDVLDAARSAQVALFGVGGMGAGTGMLVDGTVREDEMAELRAAGAVGDISAAFFDAAGRPVHTAFEQRIIGLTLEEIVQIPTRIAFAGGPGKEEALLGALTGGLMTTLVTDQRTALELLERAG